MNRTAVYLGTAALLGALALASSANGIVRRFCADPGDTLAGNNDDQRKISLRDYPRAADGPLTTAAPHFQIDTGYVYRDMGDNQFCRPTGLMAYAMAGNVDPRWNRVSMLPPESVFMGSCENPRVPTGPFLPRGLFRSPGTTIYFSDGAGRLCWFSSPAQLRATGIELHWTQMPSELPENIIESGPCSPFPQRIF